MHTDVLDRLRLAEQDVARATAALDRLRRGQHSLGELRARHVALGAALDAAIAVAGAAGTEQLHRLRTQRELHTLAGLSAGGARVPTCERATSREATGPHIAGMHMDPTPAFGPPETRTYGLDLVAALDGAAVTAGAEQESLAAVHELPAQRAPEREAALAG